MGNTASVMVFGSNLTSKSINQLDLKIKTIGRVSIFSQYLQKSENVLNVSDFDFSDEWSRKMICHDINASGVISMLDNVADYLVIDGFDSKFDIVRISINGKERLASASYLFYSFLEYAKANNMNVHVKEKIEITDEVIDDVIKRFATDVRMIYDDSQIIINEIYESKEYLSAEGEIKEYVNQQSSLIEKNIVFEKTFIEKCKKYFKNVICIGMPDYCFSSRTSPSEYNLDFFEYKKEALEIALDKKNKMILDKKLRLLQDNFNEKNILIRNNILEYNLEKEKSGDFIKISVIIPIYNVEMYISRCLDSILGQSLKEFEVICVDDCSTDRSLAVLNSYSSDERIKIIHHIINEGTSKSRKDGVLYSSGKYIMFIDSDDYLLDGAFESLYRSMCFNKVDILGFGVNVVNYNQPLQNYNEISNYVKPYCRHLFSTDVFYYCFINRKYSHNLWNKIYEGNYCRKAFEYIADCRLNKGNDRFAFFILAYYAKSYYSIEDIFYNYNYGIGISNENSLSIDSYRIYNDELMICKYLDDFIRLNNVNSVIYTNSLTIISDEIARRQVLLWLKKLNPEDKVSGFDLLIETFGIIKVLEILSKKYFWSQEDIVDGVKGSKYLVSKKESIKTIAIFYHRLSNGGVQRVMSILAPIFLKMKYTVVIFTEERDIEYDYTFPKNVKICVIPKSSGIKPEEYISHAKGYYEAIKKYNVDLVLYQASSSVCLLYDIILTKYCGIPFVPTVHELFSQQLSNRSIEMIYKMKSFELVDVVHTLNETETFFWKSLGIPSVYIRNPLTFDIGDTIPSDLSTHNVVWVGRLEDNQKCYTDAIETFSYVVQEIPDARLYMVGSGVTKEIDSIVKKLVYDRGLEKNIILCGFTTDTGKYYRDSSVFLSTSAYETYPMVFGEAMSYGLPIVTFNLPYLELLKNNNGYFSVKQKDHLECAKKISLLLKDNNLRQKMGKESRLAIERVDKLPLFDEWSILFDNILKHNYEFHSCEDEQVDIMIKTLFFHYKIGVLKYRNNAVDVGVNRTYPNNKNDSNAVKQILLKTCESLKKRGIKKTIRGAIDKLNN